MPERRRRPSSGPATKRPGAPSADVVVSRLIEQTAGVSQPQPKEDPRGAPIQERVRILFLDLDGTLTDGVITFDMVGDQRHFSIRDGLALVWARELGLLPVVISGRSSKAAELRMQDLRLEHYFGVQDKVAVAQQVMRREGVSWIECAMVGDDLPDVPLLKRVGWPIAVTDAVSEVKAIARTVTLARAGYGAVREVVERLLRHNGVWERVLERYQIS